jgi:hypothetical protein
VFARSREGVRSILAAVEEDAGLRAYYRPLRLVGKGSGGRYMSLREQVHVPSLPFPPSSSPSLPPFLSAFLFLFPPLQIVLPAVTLAAITLLPARKLLRLVEETRPPSFMGGGGSATMYYLAFSLARYCRSQSYGQHPSHSESVQLHQQRSLSSVALGAGTRSSVSILTGVARSR